MQRSQATALTRALGIQGRASSARSRDRAPSNTSDGGSTSTQLQTSNLVARVNRRFGVRTTVGKTVVLRFQSAQRSRLTEIGGQRPKAKLDQQLQSAYDYVRKVETRAAHGSQRLVKEFAPRRVPMGAQQSHRPPPVGDSSYREATDRQTSSEPPYGRPKELAAPRSSCASGAAARRPTSPTTRHGDLPSATLREEDLIKLQSVTEIAYGTPAVEVLR